ncbi:MAG: hypothetical protein KDD04_01705, partial [Sinomicrobium sp.]|nr:hypothetical protein [Sinomicrobium sp.]
DRILFFGEQGRITITTTRDFFEAEAKISGSASHKKLEEYKKNMSRFNDANLDLIEALFNARKTGDTITADSLTRLSEKNRLKSYLYTLNFALNNKDSYVAPYIALSEASDARLKYLDTIYKSLSPQVAASKYGKALGAFIESIKAE